MRTEPKYEVGQWVYSVKSRCAFIITGLRREGDYWVYHGLTNPQPEHFVLTVSMCGECQVEPTAVLDYLCGDCRAIAVGRLKP